MKRHDFDLSIAKRIFDKNIRYIPKKIEKTISKQNFRLIESFYESNIDNFYYSFALNNISKAEQIEYAKNALYSYTAYLQCIMKPDTTLKLEYAPNQYLTLPTTAKGNDGGYLDTNCFKNILLGIILRDKKRVASLRQFDMSIPRSWQARLDHYGINFRIQVEDWIMNWKNEKHEVYLNWFKQELATPEQVSRYHDGVFFTSINLAQGLIILEEGDENQLNELLQKLIENYNFYYKVDGRERASRGNSMICLEALALAAMAHDKGWNITYQSDYLPEFLVRYNGFDF